MYLGLGVMVQAREDVGFTKFASNEETWLEEFVLIHKECDLHLFMRVDKSVDPYVHCSAPKHTKGLFKLLVSLLHYWHLNLGLQHQH